MTTCLNRERKVQGSVLLIAMGVTFVLGLGLASYLTLTRTQHVSVVRSQAWNAAMGLAEAGVEEAMAQLNPGAQVFVTNNNQIIDRGVNGWSLLSDGMYHAPRRALSQGYYDVAMTPDKFPVIYATGYVTIPALSTTVSRAIRATTANNSLFRGAMVAIDTIDFKGNGVETDSFDSTDPNYNTGGLYDKAKRKAGGDVASTEGIINVQNANIMGTLYTGPDGSYKVGNGSVGDVAWVVGKNIGLQDGHYKNDFNLDIPPILPPYETAIPPDNQGTTNTWYLLDRDYMVTDSKGAEFMTGKTIFVAGNARVYVTGNFIMHGGSSIIIAPGASLELYVGGAETTITTLNNAGNCASFSYFGLPGNTSVSVSGNNLILGTIYAPSAFLKLSGSGAPTIPIDFQGACVVQTIQMNGHFNYHFDENLRKSAPVGLYQLTSWREI